MRTRCLGNPRPFSGAIPTLGSVDICEPAMAALLVAVVYGGSAKEAGLDGNIIRATQLEAIVAK